MKNKPKYEKLEAILQLDFYWKKYSMSFDHTECFDISWINNIWNIHENIMNEFFTILEKHTKWKK